MMGVMMFADSEIPDDVSDETKWNELFAKTQHKLVAAARKAREDIAQGLAKPLDLDQLETTTATNDSSDSQ